MKVKSTLFFTILPILSLCQCVDSGSMAGRPAGGEMSGVAHDANAALTLHQEGTAVVVTNQGKKVAVCSAELPNVEKFYFAENKSQVVVKSRGSHGPAIVELFDSMTGVRRARVMAYEISNGQPNWAMAMVD